MSGLHRASGSFELPETFDLGHQAWERPCRGPEALQQLSAAAAGRIAPYLVSGGAFAARHGSVVDAYAHRECPCHPNGHWNEEFQRFGDHEKQVWQRGSDQCFLQRAMATPTC